MLEEKRSDRQNSCFKPEDDQEFWQAYAELNKMIDDYDEFDKLMNISLSPRMAFCGTAKDIRRLIKKSYDRNNATFDIRLAITMLQSVKDLLLRPFSSTAQNKVYELANQIKSKPSWPHLLQGLLIGLVGAAMVATGVAILCATPGALPAVTILITLGDMLQTTGAVLLTLAGLGVSYVGAGIFAKGMRRGLSKELYDLADLSSGEREAHFVRKNTPAEEAEVYFNTRQPMSIL